MRGCGGAYVDAYAGLCQYEHVPAASAQIVAPRAPEQIFLHFAAVLLGLKQHMVRFVFSQGNQKNMKNPGNN